jgi:hypothetical protein
MLSSLEMWAEAMKAKDQFEKRAMEISLHLLTVVEA